MPLAAAHAALDDARAVLERFTQCLAKTVGDGGRLSRSKLDLHQPEAAQLARLRAEVTASEAILAWAAELGPLERDLAQVYVAQVVEGLAGVLAFPRVPGLVGWEDRLAPHRTWVVGVLNTSHLAQIAAAMREAPDPLGRNGLDEDHDDIRKLFARVSDEQVAPLAEEIHRHDRVIPEALIKAYAELGVFGISIPMDYGGHMMDHLSMCLATEELSRGSLGAGGSVITRPEICAKALLEGGSEDQKKTWLPKIASGEKLVSIAVTEPNAGSDVANLQVTATKVDGGYVLNGEKTWCTFAGRADLLLVLARTGRPDEGHRGLSLLLAEKPQAGPDEEHDFKYTQPSGGSIEGHAIPTIGYRGMHSFSVMFDDYFVPDDHRIGDEGAGFKLQMKGFAGGRIQTAARAVGVMEAAFHEAFAYADERKVFGKPLRTYTLPQSNLVRMAATLQASRQLAYQVAREMDEGRGAMEASLVKLLSCKDAEWLTREAMQLFGGMGYSEEFAVSRYFSDARVLSIFEGAEDVLAVYVVARQILRDAIQEQGA